MVAQLTYQPMDKSKTDKWPADRIAKVLSEISARVPKSLRERAFSEQPFTPNILFVVEKALEDPNFPEEKKKQLRVLKESGEFTKTTIVENKKVQKMIDNMVEREIKKEIKAGNLPPRKLIGELPHFKEIINKVEQK